jgi:hypothetical protein
MVVSECIHRTNDSHLLGSPTSIDAEALLAFNHCRQRARNLANVSLLPARFTIFLFKHLRLQTRSRN